MQRTRTRQTALPQHPPRLGQPAEPLRPAATGRSRSTAADGPSLLDRKLHVDKKSLYELSAEMAVMSAKARDGKLMPADMQGGCMTISSLGGIGGTAFTPIVNAPEVAILGVTRSSIKPIWNGSEFEPRMMVPLDLTYDHRVIDGADAARF